MQSNINALFVYLTKRSPYERKNLLCLDGQLTKFYTESAYFVFHVT